MELTAEQWELFPNVQRSVRRRSVLNQWMDAWERHGPFLPPVEIAWCMEVSRQYVHQLVQQGHLETIEVNGRCYIPIVALEKFKAEERKQGRPVKEPTLVSMYRHALKERREAGKKTA
jgi:hypothetical protein